MLAEDMGIRGNVVAVAVGAEIVELCSLLLPALQLLGGVADRHVRTVLPDGWVLSGTNLCDSL